jgi:hypothetical protein
MTAKLFFKTKIKKLLKTQAVIRTLSFLIFIYSKFVGLTCRWSISNIEEVQKALGDSNAVWVSWHAKATMMPFFWQKYFNRPMSALVSPHQDGQLIAHFLTWFHITPVNGSSNENPRQSALELMRAIKDGQDLYLSPDGPRGPRMRMKKSPIYYAQKTGKPVIFVSFSTDKALIIEKAWDKTMIALPFAKGYFALSKPLYIPAELTDEEFEEYRQKFEDMANELSVQCDTAVGRTPIMPADVNEIKFKRKN